MNLLADIAALKSEKSDLESDLDTCTQHNAELMAELSALHANRHAREDVISGLRNEIESLKNQTPIARAGQQVALL